MKQIQGVPKWLPHIKLLRDHFELFKISGHDLTCALHEAFHDVMKSRGRAWNWVPGCSATWVLAEPRTWRLSYFAAQKRLIFPFADTRDVFSPVDEFGEEPSDVERCIRTK